MSGKMKLFKRLFKRTNRQVPQEDVFQEPVQDVTVEDVFQEPVQDVLTDDPIDQTMKAYYVMELMFHKLTQFHLILHIGSYLVDTTHFMDENDLQHNPLYLAGQNLEILKFLLNYYDYSIDGGMTALIFFGKEFNVEAMKVILQHPALTISLDDQKSISTYVPLNGTVEMMTLLISTLEHVTPKNCLVACMCKMDNGIPEAPYPTPEMIDMLLNHPDLSDHSELFVMSVAFNNMTVFDKLFDYPEVDITYKYKNTTAFDAACGSTRTAMAKKLYARLDNPELIVEHFFDYMGRIEKTINDF